VALFSPNRYEWWVADLAILSIGAVDVPIYATNSAEESRYILDNSDSKICLVGTARAHGEDPQAKTKLPGWCEIVIFDEIANPPQGVLNLKDAYKEGKAYKNKDEFDKRTPCHRLR
jgi:long-chain acyl-CoA synthetase